MDIGKLGTSMGVTPGNAAPLNAEIKEEVPAPPPADRVDIGGPKKHKRNAAEKLFSTLISGVGLGSGATGGGIIGASVATAGNLISGLLAHSVTLTALTAAGLTGGIAGAVVFGVAGMYGGWKMGEWISDGAHWAYNKITSPPGK